MKEIRKVILDYAEREYKLPTDADLDTFDLFDNGYIDSMGMVQFTAILEDEFDIEFTAEELLSKEFRTVSGLESIIRRKVNET